MFGYSVNCNHVLSVRLSMPLQKPFAFLVLKGKFRLQQKYFGFNPDTYEISENDIRHSTDFVDIGGKPLIKKV